MGRLSNPASTKYGELLEASGLTEAAMHGTATAGGIGAVLLMFVVLVAAFGPVMYLFRAQQ